jgi:alkylation response protein AidB-like acyl-CoA dehydrogenase
MVSTVFTHFAAGVSMDINYSPAELAFRDEVRTFLREQLPADIAARVRLARHLSKDDHQRWQRILAKRGWYAANWPVEHGGTGWGVVQKHIFEEECAAFGAPRPISFGVNMVAPVIIKFGNEQQKAYYLPRILSGEDWWCQGYSEPGSGSDLASLKTRAERDNDHYVVNGQKTWTTLGQYANMIFCLVRTDPQAQQQRGISFLLIDMNTPGISVRPIITLDGEHEVNEVFFDTVRVPLENLVGEENNGWTCAKFLLTHERTGQAGIGISKAALTHLKQVASRERLNGRPLIEEPLLRAQIADVEMQLMAIEMSTLRILAAAQAGGVPGAQSSILKIKGSEIRQAISHLLRKVLGVHALPFVEAELALDPDNTLLHADYSATSASQYFNLRKLSIYGGSNEIQKNIIAKMILEL